MLLLFSYFTSPFSPPSARHYNSALSIWLSVDPMSDKYPSTSPYTYCANNPVRLVDEDGEDVWEPDDRPFRRSNYEQNQNKVAASSEHNFGWGISIDANLSVAAIGYSIEFGYVQDGKGSGSLFFSHGTSAGFEASVGLNFMSLFSSDFNLADFEGKSMGINISFPQGPGFGFTTDFSAGAERDYYCNNYGGFKIGLGKGAGASITHTKTRLIPLPQGMQSKTTSSQ